MTIQNPHDTFFKSIMQDLHFAQSFFRQYLPASIVNRADITTLKRVADSLVDKQLQSHYVDLLYSVELNNDKELLLHLLIEHKSYQDQTTLVQLLFYMFQACEYIAKNMGNSIYR